MSGLPWIDRIARWWQPSHSRPYSARDALAAFLENTRVDSELLNPFDERMRIDGITREQVSAFCRSFARGVRYVQRRFGTEPDQVLLSDLDAGTPRYNIDRKAVLVPYRFVANCISTGTLRQGKTEPLLLPWQEMAIMYGVEEAYHHYDISTHYLDSKQPLVAQPNDSGYDNTPLERAAKIAVREALVDFNLLDQPIAAVKVEAEDAAWLAHARRLNQSWGKRISGRIPPARLLS